MVQLRKGKAGESIGVGRHGRAGKRPLGRRGNGLEVRALHKKGFVVLSGLQELGSSDVLLFSSTLETVDATAVLLLDVDALLSQSLTLLLPSLLGRESLLIGGDQTVMLLVQSGLTLLETFSLLKGGRDIGLHAVDLGFNVSLDCIEITSHGVLVVTLFLPLCFLRCGLLGLFFRNRT